jgi:hypothetical protein
VVGVRVEEEGGSVGEWADAAGGGTKGNGGVVVSGCLAVGTVRWGGR